MAPRTALLALEDGTVFSGHRVRRRRGGCGRAVLQHLHDRLPGGPDRPELRRADRHDDDAAHRQLRGQRRRHGVARRLREGLRRARDVRRAVELARRGVAAGVPRGARRRRDRGRRHPAPHAPPARARRDARGDLDRRDRRHDARRPRAASPGLVGRDLVAEVATAQAYRWGFEMPPGCELPVDTGILPATPRYRVVAMDSGIKYNILRRLAEAGCDVTVLPPTRVCRGGPRARAGRRLLRERPGRSLGGRLPVRDAARAARA